jgi:hypothetical protein
MFCRPQLFEGESWELDVGHMTDLTLHHNCHEQQQPVTCLPARLQV